MRREDGKSEGEIMATIKKEKEGLKSVIKERFEN